MVRRVLERQADDADRDRPDDHRHLRHLDDATAPPHLRRIAVLRLVQLIAGGPLGDAAVYLGIPASSGRYNVYNTNGAITWARSRPDPDEFDAALRSLAAELNTTTDLVNYRRRRAAMQTWSMDPDTWHSIRSDSGAPRLLTASEERQRQFVSTLVWARVTSGEIIFAPRPLQDQQPRDVQRAWSTRLAPRVWTKMKTGTPKPSQLRLKTNIDSFADRLAATIDAERPT